MTRYVAVIEERPTGFGPTVWVGEVRTDHDDQPIRAWREANSSTSPMSERRFYGSQGFYPVSVGATRGDVLAKLTERAANIVESGSAGWSPRTRKAG
jgi:hypothetical protein